MLVSDGKKLDKADKSNSVVKFYNDCMEALKTVRDDNKIIFEAPARKVTINQEGKRENSAGGWALYREKLIFGKEEHDIQYYETSFPDAKTGAETFRPRRYSFNGAIDPLLVDQDPDKVFFLIFVSRHCEIMPELEAFQNKLKRDNRNIYWRVQNKKAESRVKVDFKRKLLAVENAIYEENGLSMDVLRVIAKNFQIGSVDRLDPNQLRDALAENVLATNANGRYDLKKIEAFLDLLPAKGEKKISDTAKIVALVSDLEAHNILVNKKIAGNKAAWFLGDQQLVVHSPSKKKEDALVDYLTLNPEEREMLEQKVVELTI